MKKNAVTGIITILLTAMIAVSVCPISASAVDGRSLSEYYGFSYGSYMDYLYSHEHDNYYLGTPYRSGNWRSPNGDTSYNGSSGMNCSGFVWHVLKSCILRAGGDPSDYQILSFSTPRGWYGVLEDNGIEYYIFNNKYEALRSGVMSKGDIIMMFCNEELRPSGQNHIGIYWGDGSTDVFWHSAARANYMSIIRSGGAVVKFVVAKMKPRGGTLKINLKDGGSNVLSCGEFSVYDSSGSLVSTLKQGESVRLNYGTYTVSQTKTPNGYKSDAQKKSVTVSPENQNQTLTFINYKKCGALSAEIRVRRYIPSLSKDVYFTYAGIAFDVYSDSACSNKIGSAVTNSDGKAVFGYENGKYTLDEGTQCYFKISKSNADEFKDYIFDYDGVLHAAVTADKITPACDGTNTVLEASVKGAIKTVSEPGDMFRIFYDCLCEDMCFTSCSDLNAKSEYGLNIAYADENGYSFFGIDDTLDGCFGYELEEGSYTVMYADDSTAYLNVKSGCVTDGETGKAHIEVQKGDFDLNGIVSAADAREMLRASAKLCEPVAEQISAGDFDSDGRITTAESRKLLRFCAKLENEI